MIKSKHAHFRKLLRADFDPRPAIERTGESLFRDDFEDHPTTKEIIDANIAAAYHEKLRLEYPDISQERVEARVIRLLQEEKETGRPAPDLWRARRLIGQDLQAFLQIELAGSQIFLIDEADQSQLLSDAVDPSVELDDLPRDAFEILLDDAAICRRFARAHDARKGEAVLTKTSLRDANVAAWISLRDSSAGRMRVAHLTMFTPHGGAVSQRSLELAVREEDLTAKGLREGVRRARDAGGEELGEAADEMLTTLVTMVFLACSRIATDTLVRRERVHPFATFKTRASNRSLPRKQRDRARQLLPTLPDIEVTPVSSNPEARFSVNEIAARLARVTEQSRWTPETALAERVVVDSGGSDATTHAGLHPQVVADEFPGLGRSGHSFRRFTAEAQRRVELLMERQEAGREGVVMDTVALDIQPEILWSARHILPIYQARLLELEIEDRPRDIAPLRGLVDLHAELLLYRKAGRHCFLLNGDVAQLMSWTELSDIPLSEVRLPYDALYLAFENPIQMPLEDGDHFLDGAYLSGNLDSLSILLIFRPIDPRGHPILDFRTPLKITLQRDDRLSLEEAILTAIEDGGYDLERADAVDLPSDIQVAAQAAGIDISSVARTTQTKIAERNEALFGTMTEAVTIVANTIMAMTAGPEEIELRKTYANISSGTRQLLLASSAEVRANGDRAAQDEDALPVRVIALSNEVRSEQQADAERLRNSLKVAFWRKGHWRRQAYGPGHSLRKWVWIKPKLYNADGEIRHSGSVYEASSSPI